MTTPLLDELKRRSNLTRTEGALGHDVHRPHDWDAEALAEIERLNKLYTEQFDQWNEDAKRLTVERDRLRAALLHATSALDYASGVFLSYEQMHLAKGPDGADKAKRNAEHAEMMTTRADAARAALHQEGE